MLLGLAYTIHFFRLYAPRGSTLSRHMSADRVFCLPTCVGEIGTLKGKRSTGMVRTTNTDERNYIWDRGYTSLFDLDATILWVGKRIS